MRLIMAKRFGTCESYNGLSLRCIIYNNLSTDKAPALDFPREYPYGHWMCALFSIQSCQMTSEAGFRSI